MGAGGGVREQGRGGFVSADKRVRTVIIVAMVVLASGITAASVVDRQERGVAFTVHTDKVEYAVGEEIFMYAEYMNYGFDSVDMTFGSSAVAWFSVHDLSGSLVRGIPQTVLCVMVYETLEPGEALCGGCSWNQTDDMCEQVLSPGSYMIFAWGGGWEFDFSASTQISITA